jgi:hypothetical protein
MARIRIPEAKIPLFKEFCKSFSIHLQNRTGVRLRGNILLNTVAKAARHDSYTALLIDAKIYGRGKLSWELLPGKLAEDLSRLTSTKVIHCFESLVYAAVNIQKFEANITGDILSLCLQNPPFPIPEELQVSVDLSPAHSMDHQSAFRFYQKEITALKELPLPFIQSAVIKADRADLETLFDMEPSLSNILLYNKFVRRIISQEISDRERTILLSIYNLEKPTESDLVENCRIPKRSLFSLIKKFSSRYKVDIVRVSGGRKNGYYQILDWGMLAPIKPT